MESQLAGDSIAPQYMDAEGWAGSQSKAADGPTPNVKDLIATQNARGEHQRVTTRAREAKNHV